MINNILLNHNDEIDRAIEAVFTNVQKKIMLRLVQVI